MRRMGWRSWGPRGVVVLAVLIIAVAVCAPLLSWHQPLVCKHNGAVYFPAVVDTLRQIPIIGRYIEKSKPFRFPSFDARTALDPDAFAVWPPVPYGPSELVADANLPRSTKHWLGTDDRGRDVLARLIHGTQVSVRVGLYSMLLAGVIGMLFGAVAGYFGGAVDWTCSRIIEVMMCVPAFFLILAVMVWIGDGLNAVILVIGLTQWTAIARLVRAEFLRDREADFVLAARSYGASNRYIIWRHMLPGAVGPVLVAMTFGVGDAILLEAGLSWLGLGVPAPIASWGGMLREGYDQIRTHPGLMVSPCIAIFLCVLFCQLFGERLRRSLDPRNAFREIRR